MYWLNPLHLHTSNQRTLDPLAHSTTVQLLPPGDTSKTGVAQILKKSLVSFCSSCCRLTRSSSWNPDLRSSEIKLSWEELDQVFISKQIRRCHILRRNCCLTAIPNKRVSLLLPSFLLSFISFTHHKTMSSEIYGRFLRSFESTNTVLVWPAPPPVRQHGVFSCWYLSVHSNITHTSR